MAGKQPHPHRTALGMGAVLMFSGTSRHGQRPPHTHRTVLGMGAVLMFSETSGHGQRPPKEAEKDGDISINYGIRKM